MYTKIESREQYFEYCSILETMVESGRPKSETGQEIDLLTQLIEAWDEEQEARRRMVTQFVNQIADGSVTVFAEKMEIAKANTRKAFLKQPPTDEPH